MSRDQIREALAERPTLVTAWLGLGAPLVAEIAGRAGVDLITIDQQHGLGGPDNMVGALMGARAAGLPALVRVATNDTGLIGRALDAGAQGVICPMVNTKADAVRLVDAVKYPPLGARSAGPIRASLVVDGDYITEANAWTIACAQIETAEAMDNLDAILSVRGLDMVLVGPNDLTISLTGGRARDITAPGTTAAIDKIRQACRTHGVISGIYANDATFAKPLIAKGWQIISIGSDSRWVAAGAKAAVELVRGSSQERGPVSPY